MAKASSRCSPNHQQGEAPSPIFQFCCGPPTRRLGRNHLPPKMQGSGSRKPPAGGKSNSNPNSGGARPGTKAGGTPARPATMPAAQKSTSLPLEPQWVITDPNAQASLGQVPLQLQTTGQHQVFHLPPPGDHTGLLANSMGALTAGRFSPAIAAAGTAGAKNGLVGQASGAATGKAVANAGGDKAAAAKPKKEKRKKVTQACVYCRRSHMTCGEDNLGSLLRGPRRGDAHKVGTLFFCSSFLPNFLHLFRLGPRQSVVIITRHWAAVSAMYQGESCLLEELCFLLSKRFPRLFPSRSSYSATSHTFATMTTNNHLEMEARSGRRVLN